MFRIPLLLIVGKIVTVSIWMMSVTTKDEFCLFKFQSLGVHLHYKDPIEVIYSWLSCTAWAKLCVTCKALNGIKESPFLTLETGISTNFDVRGNVVPPWRVRQIHSGSNSSKTSQNVNAKQSRKVASSVLFSPPPVKPGGTIGLHSVSPSVPPSVCHTRFPHFSPTCIDILSWNFAYDFV